jgi:hypothetical protein
MTCASFEYRRMYVMVPEQITQDKQGIAEQLMFEYEQLRKEILQNDAQILQIMGGILILTSAIMGFAFQYTSDPIEKCSLFTLASFVSYIGISQNVNKLTNTVFIASYIRIFIEPLLNIKWETRLSQFRSIAAKHKIPIYINNHNIMYTFIILTNALFSGYYWIIAYTNGSQRPLFLFATIAIIMLFIVALSINKYIEYIKLSRNGIDIYERVWSKVKKER